VIPGFDAVEEHGVRAVEHGQVDRLPEFRGQACEMWVGGGCELAPRRTASC
jgi:hypothetical protein